MMPWNYKLKCARKMALGVSGLRIPDIACGE